MNDNEWAAEEFRLTGRAGRCKSKWIGRIKMMLCPHHSRTGLIGPLGIRSWCNDCGKFLGLFERIREKVEHEQ